MWQADQVVASRWIERFGRKRDESLKSFDRAISTLRGGNSGSSWERLDRPDPFECSRLYRTFLRQFTLEPLLPQLNRLPPLSPELQRLDEGIPTLSDVGLDRNPRVIQGGEDAAWQRLNEFIDGPAAVYSKGRNRLDRAGTSRISADLKFGLLSPLQVWWAMENAEERPRDAGSFLRQLVWREFSHHTLWHQPHLLEKPFRPDFEGFPWLDDPGGWDAWVTGQTGYPVVDASARKLLAEGFVPNRARMISASFLTKHLGIDYRRGEAHYLRWRLGSEQSGVAVVCGLRLRCSAVLGLQLILQGQKFDPAGTWVRQWVPELAELPKRWIHEPWNAPEKVLTAAGVELGATYPEPVVEHRFARQRFLATAKAHLSKA